MEFLRVGTPMARFLRVATLYMRVSTRFLGGPGCGRTVPPILTDQTTALLATTMADGTTIMLVVPASKRPVAVVSFVVLLSAFLITAPAFAQSGGAASGVDLSVLDAVILGLVEGLTEYLPVSSTGHLLIANELLGLNSTEEAERLMDSYAICIQAGAILAVLVVYKERIRQMVEGVFGRSEEGRRVAIAVVVAFVPTAIIAQLIFDPVRKNIFNTPSIAAAWIVGGVAILLMTRAGFFERAGKELGELTWQNAFVIGLMQTLAIWPGTSRSLITIIAGILVGLTLRAAVEFAFLLGLITLSAATAYEGLGSGAELVDTFGVLNPLIGLVVAFASAVAAVKWMVSYLNDKGFDVFGWYRITAGVVAFALIGLDAI